MGIIGFIDDSNITMRDNDFSTFIRSLGAVMGGQGMTAVYALATIDKKSLVALEPLVNSVYSKMNLGLDDKQIWDKFIGESGSNLIYKYLNIYLDTITLGGPPDAIGNRGRVFDAGTDPAAGEKGHACPQFHHPSGADAHSDGRDLCRPVPHHGRVDRVRRYHDGPSSRKRQLLPVAAGQQVLAEFLPAVHSAGCPCSPISLKRRWGCMLSQA